MTEARSEGSTSPGSPANDDHINDFDCHGTVVIDNHEPLTAIPSCGTMAPWVLDHECEDDRQLTDRIVFVDVNKLRDQQAAPARQPGLLRGGQNPRKALKDTIGLVLCRIASSHPTAIVLCGESVQQYRKQDWTEQFRRSLSGVPVVISRDSTIMTWLAPAEAEDRPRLEQALITSIPLKPGDHIAREINGHVSGQLATHHGIYVGNGRVIHFSGNEAMGGLKGLSAAVGKGKAKVRCTSVLQFMKYGYNLRVKRYAEPTADKKTVERAEAAFHEQWYPSYHLLKNNCEHFAHYCKTGRAQSSQVHTALAVGVGVIGVAAVGITALGLGALGGAIAARGRSNERSRSPQRER
ncbi:unnamed protein product [Vitrella brassicaformis CCMP3155]|uniref:LRAT domain-containing protein n=2 Tax=Vitrella brassicaformis TaxID=1169539 RepID=A0A0G4G0F0_VITBC|nr:unnamed protein product [Vitrella brassicaformis CCMP3155]|eukprot:CEM21234.1 unnamed protein product [Vitrella brassicaformis CCMP3155]